MGAAARGDLAQLEVGSEELPGLGDEAVEVAFGAGRVDERGGARDVEAGDELGGAPRGPRRRRGGARAAAPGRPAPSASARRAGDRRVAHEASNLHHGNGLGPPCTPIAPSPGHDRATTVLLASGGAPQGPPRPSTSSGGEPCRCQSRVPTGARTFVVNEDGEPLGVAAAGLLRHDPHPAWIEHDPEEIVRVQRETLRERCAGQRSGPTISPPSVPPTSARPRSCWGRTPGSPSTRDRLGLAAERRGEVVPLEQPEEEPRIAAWRAITTPLIPPPTMATSRGRPAAR